MPLGDSIGSAGGDAKPESLEISKKGMQRWPFRSGGALAGSGSKCAACYEEESPCEQDFTS